MSIGGSPVAPVSYSLEARQSKPLVSEGKWMEIFVLCFLLRRRQRNVKAGSSPYRALLESLQLTQDSMKIQLVNEVNKVNTDGGDVFGGRESLGHVLSTESAPWGCQENNPAGT